MNFKHLAVAAAVSSATFSGAALAQLSGNVGLTSEYFFRGLAQSGGSAVSGGLDYAAESGFYVGTWASTINFASAEGSGTEVDLYAGFGGEAGSVGYDIGAIYYWYSEEGEAGADPDPSNNTLTLRVARVRSGHPRCGLQPFRLLRPDGRIGSLHLPRSVLADQRNVELRRTCGLHVI